MAAPATRLIADRGGAVAPTIALSLFALIAIGGVGFDYARMASMDTELQNAADQAALAAASQLDAQPGACSRAAGAARALITNLTYMANDGAARSVVIANEPACDVTGNVRFYQDKAKTSPATLDENAKFVEVQVNPRTAVFALTPVVAAFSSGPLRAIAFAGLGESICRVPPLMMCNPDETNDPDFTTANYIGKGNRLVANDGGGNYGPGNFGFLEVGQGNGASALLAALGRQGSPGDCTAGGGVTTEPGNMISLRDALNTRFDMYGNGLNQACGTNGSLCPASANSRKDMVRQGTGNNACGYVTGKQNGWKVPTSGYPPTVLTSDRELTQSEIDPLRPMGYPRDTCHAFSVTGSCIGGIIGDGEWDRYAYFRSHRSANYIAEGASVAAMNSFLTNTFGTTTPSRYQVYEYEMGQAATRLRAVSLGGSQMAHGTPVCAPPGVTPSSTAIDRRLLSVAVVNCKEQMIKGRTKNVEVTKFINIFLVEPSEARTRPADGVKYTENSDIYVEMVGETVNTTNGNNFQVVKKSVPYLIE